MRKTLTLIALVALFTTPVLADDAGALSGNWFEDLVEWVTELLDGADDETSEPGSGEADFGPFIDPGG